MRMGEVGERWHADRIFFLTIAQMETRSLLTHLFIKTVGKYKNAIIENKT